MSAKSLGVSRWLAPSTIATSLLMAMVLGSAAPAASAADPVLRVIAAVGPERLGAFGLSAEGLRRDCARDALCAARSIVAGDARARLARTVPPDPDPPGPRRCRRRAGW